MTGSTNIEPTHAYTRQAVEEYLQGVETQKAELEGAIAQARSRQAWALDVEQRMVALERRVGESIVLAHAQADPRYQESLAEAAPEVDLGPVTTEPPWSARTYGADTASGSSPSGDVDHV